METIEKAEPFFIFCVRSNAKKVTWCLYLYHQSGKVSSGSDGIVHHLANVYLFLQKELQFDDELVLQQIRYTGLMQMVQVQKSGYSAKYTFKVRLEVYRYSI